MEGQKCVSGKMEPQIQIRSPACGEMSSYTWGEERVDLQRIPSLERRAGPSAWAQDVERPVRHLDDLEPAPQPLAKGEKPPPVHLAMPLALSTHSSLNPQSKMATWIHHYPA